MILFTPYHDPKGLWNERLLNALPFLQSLFSSICLSFTPTSAKENPLIITKLNEKGVKTKIMEEGTSIGDHFRGALSLAVEINSQEPLFYLNVDRLLFSIHEYKDEFINDIKTFADTPLHLFHRTELAWSTHPQNYRDMEQGLDLFAKHIIGYPLEFGLCSFICSSENAKKMLETSIDISFAVVPEWILTIAKQQPSTSEVNWLAWEDPYIEQRNQQELKQEREQATTENKKRLTNVKAFLHLLENKM